MNSHEVFIHIHQGCFAGTGAIVRLPQCQWSKPDGYGKISQCITTTKHSRAKAVCIFLGIYRSRDVMTCIWFLNSLARSICGSNSINVISKHMLRIKFIRFWISWRTTSSLLFFICLHQFQLLSSLKYDFNVECLDSLTCQNSRRCSSWTHLNIHGITLGRQRFIC